MKIVVGRSQELYLIEAGRIIDVEIIFSVCLVSSGKLAYGYRCVPPETMHSYSVYESQYSLHSQEIEAVRILIFKRFRDIERGEGNLSCYVYRRGCTFMESLDTTLSLGILCDKTVIYTVS
jgi:hypothetical protein